MNRLFIILALLLFAGARQAAAQRTLEVKNLTDNTSTFEGEGQEGGVVIRCKSGLILNFDSNVDANVTLDETHHIDETDETYYCLVFKAGIRILTVMAEGYNPVDINLSVAANRMYVYQLVDPDDEVSGTFYQKQMKQGQIMFDECDYMSARDAFRAAANSSQATDMEKSQAKQLVANCDSVMKLRKLGFLAADRLDFEQAIEYLTEAMKYSPRDKELVDKAIECSTNNEKRCSEYLEAGDHFFKQKEYSDAIFMYKKVEERNCEESINAVSRRLRAESLLKSRNNFDRYIGIEAGQTYGLTFAKYRKRTGGYVSLKANADLFRLAQSKRRLDDHGTAELTFGWTFPLIKSNNNVFRGVWVHLGIGALTRNQFVADSENNEKLTCDFGWAVVPEGGVFVKIWHFAVRCTGQYRFVLRDKYDDLISPRRLSLGIGYCW